MVHVCGVWPPPVFPPHPGDYIQGMATTVLLRNDTLPGRPTAQVIHQALSSYYKGQTVFVLRGAFAENEPVISLTPWWAPTRWADRLRSERGGRPL